MRNEEEFEFFSRYSPRVYECPECGAPDCHFDHEAADFDPEHPGFPFWFDADDKARYLKEIGARKAALKK